MIDMDLEKFFDRVNHDRLMARVAQRVADKRVLKLIRAFLNARVMEDGLVRLIDEGTPQGGPLSPLLSNLVLDELDKELELRGHVPEKTLQKAMPRAHRGGLRAGDEQHHLAMPRLQGSWFDPTLAKDSVEQPM